jgi:hypothetical protein
VLTPRSASAGGGALGSGGVSCSSKCEVNTPATGERKSTIVVCAWWWWCVPVVVVVVVVVVVMAVVVVARCCYCRLCAWPG